MFNAGGGGEGIDVLAGGSPCQPYSLANRHSDHRSDYRTELVFTFLDILQELGPKFFLLENVSTFMAGHRHHTATSRVPSPLPRVIARLLEMGCTRASSYLHSFAQAASDGVSPLTDQARVVAACAVGSTHPSSPEL